MGQRRFWRVLQFAAGALLVGIAVRSVAVNWQSLQAQPIEMRLSPAWLAASVLVVFASYAVLIEAWRRVVLSMGERLEFLTAARIWFLASLGKYVPGKVWAIAGAAVLAQRAGVDPSVAVAGAIVLQVLALASGAAVVALTAREAFQLVGQGAATPIAGAGNPANRRRPSGSDLSDRAGCIEPAASRLVAEAPGHPSRDGSRRLHRQRAGVVRVWCRIAPADSRAPPRRYADSAADRGRVHLLISRRVSCAVCAGWLGSARVRISPDVSR